MSAAEVSLLAGLCVSVLFNMGLVGLLGWLLVAGRIGVGRVYDPFGRYRRTREVTR